MMRKYLLPAIALIGAIGALLVVFWSQKKVPAPPIPYPPPRPPYASAIAGVGIIEAASQNISIGSPFNEVVSDVFVVEGDFVKEGDLLFQLDLRAFEAQKEAVLAALKAAAVTWENTKTQFSFYQRLSDTRAVSEQAYQQALFAMLEAESQVKVAQANLNEVEVNIERSRIRAPLDGLVLQVNIQPGAVAINDPAPPLAPYLPSPSTMVLLGAVHPLFMRIDIDEEDCWRFKKNAPATAFVRGNSAIHFPMQYVRVEPYVIPKASFTGDTTERIDTRVLQVLYSFEKGDLPVYAGQLLDVFIEAPSQETP